MVAVLCCGTEAKESMKNRQKSEGLGEGSGEGQGNKDLLLRSLP